jgi:hypothetical protein
MELRVPPAAMEWLKPRHCVTPAAVVVPEAAK